MSAWSDVRLEGERDRVVSSDIDQLVQLLLNIARRTDEGQPDESRRLQSRQQ
jgi:hypothetical protein